MVAAPVRASPRRYDESMTTAVAHEPASASHHVAACVQAAAASGVVSFPLDYVNVCASRGCGSACAFALH